MGKVKVDAEVIRVLDGDTIEVKMKVRLNRIDAMETKGIERQRGLIAAAWLKARLEGKEIRLEIPANDKYYRALAEVWDGETNIGDEMLERQLAEVYTPRNHNNGKLDV